MLPPNATRPSGSEPFASDPGLRPEHLYKAIGLALLAALFYRYFSDLSRVLLVIYAAAIVAVALNAVVSRLPGRRSWVTAGLGVALLAVLALTIWFGGRVLIQQLRDLVEQWPQLQRELEAWGARFARATGLDPQPAAQQASERLRGFLSGMDGGQVVGRAAGLLEAILLPLLILIGALFALAKPNEGLLVPALRLVPAERRPAFRRGLSLLGERLLGWVRGQLLAMAGVGILAIVAFYIIGVPYALLLGVFYGLAEFVPILGPWVGGIPAVVLAFLDDPTKGLWAIAAMVAIQQVEANLITPFAMSRGADVHPFVTLFSLLLFGSIFGFLGILLAIPLVLLIATALQVLWVERAIETGRDRIEPVVDE